ncbi:hypothetical protein [Streptomyces sp. NPDC058664]|uniref:hypothetical protein n=1 Tax=unclassified Streptomyces TaxID=2593676 RepID=UPI003660CCFF
MGVKLGAAQEEALGVWGNVYGKTSGTLHGVAAEAGRTAGLYTEVLAAARELLVPLPGRAPRVLELTALDQPGPDQARELARWADPRATAFFFRSRPAAAWLPVLQKYAPHLLHPDVPAGGVWPAAVFFEYLADAAPVAACPNTTALEPNSSLHGGSQTLSWSPIRIERRLLTHPVSSKLFSIMHFRILDTWRI